MYVTSLCQVVAQCDCEHQSDQLWSCANLMVGFDEKCKALAFFPIAIRNFIEFKKYIIDILLS